MYMGERRLKVTALAGGVGAAKFLTGLMQLISQDDLSVIVNTGDDIELFGLHISPDVDIISYTLAGIVDEDKGWGIKNDTFHCLDMLKAIGTDTWFNLGDRDLATHIYRTSRLKQGKTLTQVTTEIAKSLGLKAQILPMSNDKFETRITTKKGTMHFEEYFVKHRFSDEILNIDFVGAKTADPSPGVLDAILSADLVIVCPSNPVVSIGTILAVNGIRDALQRTDAKVVAVSPIVAGLPLKGPADKMMRFMSVEVSALGVAKLYSNLVDAFVIDSKDSHHKAGIEALGLRVYVTNTVMQFLQDKVSLARVVLEC